MLLDDGDGDAVAAEAAATDDDVDGDCDDEAAEEDEEEEEEEADALEDEDVVVRCLEPGGEVDSCSCTNIMWSPNLMARVRGDFPDKKSFTCWDSVRFSSACITLFSFLWDIKPLSTCGNRVSRQSSYRPLLSTDPSLSILSLNNRLILSLESFKRCAIVFLIESIVSW